MTSWPAWVWQVLAAIVAMVLFAWMWWKLPPLLYRYVTDDTARVKAITDTRTALLAGLLGIGAIGTFWLNSRVYKITARTLQLSEQGHITERYTKAIEQLGSTRLDVRLGGIYALERVATDSARDHPTVVEVLSAFVREHSLRPGASISPASNRLDTTTDVRAAVSVLGRLPRREGVPRAQLAAADLSGADLGGADLSGADLGGADLSGAGLSAAILSGADLRAAILSGADLRAATLSDADLGGADLSGADLSGADVSGADLRAARGLRQGDADSAKGDGRTRLPERLQRPNNWA